MGIMVYVLTMDNAGLIASTECHNQASWLLKPPGDVDASTLGVQASQVGIETWV